MGPTWGVTRPAEILGEWSCRVSEMREAGEGLLKSHSCLSHPQGMKLNQRYLWGSFQVCDCLAATGSSLVASFLPPALLPPLPDPRSPGACSLAVLPGRLPAGSLAGALSRCPDGDPLPLGVLKPRAVPAFPFLGLQDTCLPGVSGAEGHQHWTPRPGSHPPQGLSFLIVKKHSNCVFSGRLSPGGQLEVKGTFSPLSSPKAAALKKLPVRFRGRRNLRGEGWCGGLLGLW